MPEHLRVTIGLESENRKFLKSLEVALGISPEMPFEINQSEAAAEMFPEADPKIATGESA
jgi:histidinol-phosphate aminotransferase